MNSAPRPRPENGECAIDYIIRHDWPRYRQHVETIRRSRVGGGGHFDEMPCVSPSPFEWPIVQFAARDGAIYLPRGHTTRWR